MIRELDFLTKYSFKDLIEILNTDIPIPISNRTYTLMTRGYLIGWKQFLVKIENKWHLNQEGLAEYIVGEYPKESGNILGYEYEEKKDGNALHGNVRMPGMQEPL